MWCHYDAQRGWYIDDITIDRAIELTQVLMKEYNVPIANVLRHYDVTGKNCPAPLIDDAKWKSVKDRISARKIDELTTPNDIVWELSARGIVQDVEGMLAEMQENEHGRLYWLARKTVQYMRENGV